MRHNILYLTLVLLTLVGGIFIWDKSYRNNYFSVCENKTVVHTFFQNSNPKQAYSKHFDDTKWDFPRADVARINVAENKPVTGYLFSRNLSEKKQNQLLAFFRNPDNFTWNETTWHYSENDFQIRLYDAENNQIGKIWICTSCRMCRTVPFTPDVKFGHIKKDSLKILLQIIN